MTTRATMSALVVLATAGASPALAAPVNLGNLTVYNSPLTIINFNGPTGGTYTKFVYTTNWTFGSGTAFSNAAAWSLNNQNNNASIVSGFTSVAGMAANGNTTTITITGTLSIGVTSGTALEFVASQNPFSGGGAFSHSAFWSSTTLNFYVPKPPPPTPTGIVNMGVITATSGQRVTVDTGGSTFTPGLALYAEDGLLLASNDSGGTGVPSTALEDMTLSPGVYYLFAAGEGASFGPEDLDVFVPPGTPGGTLAGGVNGVAWPDPTVSEGDGRWYAIIVTTPPCPGDLDADDDTDVFDFAVFAANFGRDDVLPYSHGDMDGNANVNVLDFGAFAGNFGCDAAP